MHAGSSKWDHGVPSAPVADALSEPARSTKFYSKNKLKIVSI